MSDVLLDFHRELVETRSESHDEAAIAQMVFDRLSEWGAQPERLGRNVVARAGRGPKVILCSHLDTVPATEAWTREPWKAIREGDRIYGLGSNDAKASVAAMTQVFLDVLKAGGPCEVLLMLVPEEETGGDGAEVAWPWVREWPFEPDGVVIGEPTNLDIASSQKGLMILELTAKGDTCHAANAAAMEAVSAVRALARDIVALDGVDLGPAHADLGVNTLEPTVLRAGERRNVVPGEASVWLDLRTVPGIDHTELAARVKEQVSGDVRVHSDRLRAIACPEDAPLLAAARDARPESKVYGSRTMSDMVWFRDVPVIKVGPGRTERSHTPDEFVLASEIEAGREFYSKLIHAFAKRKTSS